MDSSPVAGMGCPARATAMRLHTDVCRLFGIEHPLVSAPMGGVARAELAAAVSEAGGLGLMGLTGCSPEEIRQEIARVRARTARPFGVGLLFPTDLSTVELKVPSRLPSFLAPVWEQVKDIPDPPPGPVLTRELARVQMAVLVEERVPVVACGLGTPEWVVQQARTAGVRVISLVGSVKAARSVDALGVDAIVAQGYEAGGHTGRVGTLVLVPQIVDAVRAPVIAAGGIVDGRGLVAALALGAQGALLGTRFLATPEAQTDAAHKQAIVAMDDDTTIVSRCYTGKPSRILRNRMTSLWAGHEDEILPMPAQRLWMDPLVRRARVAGLVDLVNYPTGQAATRIWDIQPAGEVVRQIVAEAAELLARGLTRHVDLDTSPAAAVGVEPPESQR